MATTIKRPLLKYHGGKWRLAPWIIAQMPEHRVYVEPFGGGGSVLIRKPRSYAEVYNDLDGEIVNLFRMARDEGDELVRAIEMTPFARDEFNLSYEASDDPLEQARRTLVRCGMGFGSTGMIKSHKTGFRGLATRSDTTPATDWMNQPNNLHDVVQRLRGVTIENSDAAKVMMYHDASTTLHYCDPPYVHSSRTWMNAKKAYRHEMSDGQHEELAEMLHGLQGAVILSGYRTKLYAKLYRGWRSIEMDVLADKAKKRVECLWFNEKAWAGRPQPMIDFQYEVLA